LTDFVLGSRYARRANAINVIWIAIKKLHYGGRGCGGGRGCEVHLPNHFVSLGKKNFHLISYLFCEHICISYLLAFFSPNFLFPLKNFLKGEGWVQVPIKIGFFSFDWVRGLVFFSIGFVDWIFVFFPQFSRAHLCAREFLYYF